MHLRNILLALLLLWVSPLSFANNIAAQLNLISLKGLHASESYGDELYFNVTEFRRDHIVKHYSIPEFPAVWSSKALENIPKLKLWEQELANNERVELLVTLVEHDNPPWDREDILGTVKVLLKNDNGKLIVKWLEATNSETFGKEKKQASSMGRFLFKGAKGLYQVDFQIITL